MIVKLLTEHYLEFPSLKGGCSDSSESTHVKMSHCWKSHVPAQLFTVIPLGQDKLQGAVTSRVESSGFFQVSRHTS